MWSFNLWFTPSADFWILGFEDVLCCVFSGFLTLLRCLNVFPLDSNATELINKLNFLEDEDQDSTPTMMNNPFDEPDGDFHPYPLNPFGDPDEEGR